MSESNWSTMTETELREAQAPYPETEEELSAVVKALAERQHDYGTCVYAMSIAANASFNYIAHKLGVTGFQASCADMDFMRRTRGWQGPAMVVDLADHLYPQYDLVKRVQEAIDNNAEWFATAAQKNLSEERTELPAHPNVIAHWRRLASARSAS